MKRLIVALVFVAMGSAHAVGLEKKKLEGPAVAPKPLALAPASPSSIETVPNEQMATATAQIRLAPGAMVLIGETGSAAGIGGVASIGLFNSSRSDLGLDLGYFQLSSISIIPIQFSWVRRFSEGPVRPYIGLSAGVSIVSANKPPEFFGVSGASTAIAPSLALRPGVEVSLTRSLGLFVEARGGLLLTIPFLNPQLGVTLAL
jgi:hypothetical protein